MHQGRPLQHICRSLAREGQQGYFGRIDSVFAKPGQAIDNCPGLAAARAGHNKRLRRGRWLRLRTGPDLIRLA